MGGAAGRSWVRSVFNIAVEVDGETYVVNTRTQAVAPAGLSRKLLDPAEPKISSLEEKFLRMRGFIVDAATKKQQFEALEVEYHRARYNPAIVSLTVTPSYECNCLCPECPQLDFDREPVISDEHIQAAMGTLEEMISVRRPRNVALWLYGGEPFASPRQCLLTINGAREVCERMRVRLQVMATTNGTLIRAPALKNVVEKVDLFYVSLSESKEAHGIQRPYVGGKNGYDDTVEGIAHVAELGKKLIIRFNLTNRDGIVENLSGVLDDLYRAMGENAYPDIKFEFKSYDHQPTCGVTGPKLYAASSGRALLKRIGRKKDREETPKSLEMTDVLLEIEQVVERSAWPLENYRLPHGGAVMPPSLHEVGFITMCDYTRGSGVAIGPLGEHYLCAPHVQLPKYRMGHVKQSPYQNARYLQVINASPFDDPICETCEYVPLCYVNKCGHHGQHGYPHPDGRTRYSTLPLCREDAHAQYTKLVRLKQRIAASEDGVDPRFPMGRRPRV